MWSLFCTNINKKIGSKVSDITPKSIKQSLGNVLTRNGLTFLDLGLDNSKFYFCAWCGHANFNFELEYIIIENNLTITGIKYINSVVKYGCFNNKINKECRRRKLNPNSIEFVKLSRGLTADDEAIEIIHSRNKTKFYKENHPSPESYKKYQGTRTTENKTEEEIRKIIDKGVYSKSLERYKSEFGEIQGEIKWKNIQKLKAINIENLARVHGEEKAKIIFKNWVNNTRNTYDNFIRRHGIEEGRRRFDKMQNERLNISWGTIHFTDKNEKLSSTNEYNFYIMMKQFGLDKEEYIIERNYPGSSYRSDFYFVDINLHIEIAGLLQLQEYRDKMKMKKEKFGAKIIIPNNKEFLDACLDIKYKFLKLRGLEVNECFN